MKEVEAVHVTTMAMVCCLLVLVPGCHESKGKERALAFAERMLQAQKKRAIRDPLDKVWADEYQLPGIHRGLKALESARHGRWNVAVPMWSHLTVYRCPEGISGDLAVAAIHQPGHSDISGVYFITKDGKTYECSAVNEYETEDHPGWEHYLYFLLAERAKLLNDNEKMYAVRSKTDVVRVDKQFFEPGYLQMGILMRSGERSDTVPVYVKEADTSDTVDAGAVDAQ